VTIWPKLECQKTSLFSRLFSCKDLSQFGPLVEESFSMLYSVQSTCPFAIVCLAPGAWHLVFGAWRQPKNLKYFHISHLFSCKDLSQFGHLVEESSSSTLLKLTLSDCLEYVFGMVCLSDNSLSKYNSTINNYENVNRNKAVKIFLY